MKLNLLMWSALIFSSRNEAQKILPESIGKLSNLNMDLSPGPILTRTLHGQLN